MTPSLATSRCDLQPPTIDDAEWMFEEFSHPSFPKELPLGAISSLRGAANWIRECLGGMEEGTLHSWVVTERATGMHVGQVTLARREEGQWGLAYWIGHAFRRYGFAHESVDAALEFAEYHLAPVQIVAGVDDWNSGSIRVIAKHGFHLLEQQEGFALYERSFNGGP